MIGTEILTVAEMAEADRLTVASGVPPSTLMENAGRSVAEEIAKRFKPCAAVVLCGPGNNGGDGFVAARYLKAKGFDVRVSLLGARDMLKGDAATMAKRWEGDVTPLTNGSINGAALIVDALFGIGLSRPLEGEVLQVAASPSRARTPTIAIDIPSGIHGDLGKRLSDAAVFAADLTVTFFRKKPAHVLYPGRGYCGEVVVVDIGIPNAVLESLRIKTFENGPELWGHNFSWPHPEGHKYTRGHVVVVSGPAHATGAARLAARGALRVGAGLVSVASPPDAVAVNAAHLTAIMVKPIPSPEGLRALLTDKRLNAVVVGPGCGVGRETQKLVTAVIESEASVVLDADALTSIADNPKKYLVQRHTRVVLTPHDGEFERLFPNLLKKSKNKIEATRAAAQEMNCTVLFKGPDTVIADPKGFAAINTNAPAWLATAGSGDVLSGFVAGLLHMEPWKAACAAAWLHGEAAKAFGPGLIAEDLPEALPEVLRALQVRKK